MQMLIVVILKAREIMENISNKFVEQEQNMRLQINQEKTKIMRVDSKATIWKSLNIKNYSQNENEDLHHNNNHTNITFTPEK